MCYSTRQTRKKEQLESRLEVEAALKDPSYQLELTYFHANGFDSPVMWIVPQHDPNILLPAKWGIMDSYFKMGDFDEFFSKKNKAYHMNAQSEKFSGFYSERYKPMERRCIIPVDGFFEPHNTHVKVKGRDYTVPFYFTHKENAPIYLAGLYNIHKDGATFTIWTRAADQEKDSMFFTIHNKKGERRRPVIFDEHEIWSWLNGKLSEEQVKNMMVNDMRQEELTAHPISKDLYSKKVSSNYNEIIEREDHKEISIQWE